MNSKPFAIIRRYAIYKSVKTFQFISYRLYIIGIGSIKMAVKTTNINIRSMKQFFRIVKELLKPETHSGIPSIGTDVNPESQSGPLA